MIKGQRFKTLNFYMLSIILLQKAIQHIEPVVKLVGTGHSGLTNIIFVPVCNFCYSQGFLCCLKTH